MASTLGDVLEVLSGMTSKPTRYGWVFENGLQFDSQPLVPREWPMIVRHVQYFDRQDCFANCQRTVLAGLVAQFDEIVEGRVGVLSPFQYVEGYLTTASFPVPLYHAWLLLNGKVVDPTHRLHTPARRLKLPGFVMGAFPPSVEYYGVVLPWRDVVGCVRRNKGWHGVLDDPAGV